MIDFDQPVGLLLVAVLHFLPDDAVAYDVVSRLVAAAVPGSYLVVSHASADEQDLDHEMVGSAQNLYRQRTATPFHLRSREQVERFFTGLDLVEPGVTWLPQWRPAPTDPTDFADAPQGSAGLAGIAHIR